MRPVIRAKTENIVETCVKLAGHRIFWTDTDFKQTKGNTEFPSF